MPTKPRSPCTYPGCPALSVKGGRCVRHQRIAWEGRRGFEGYKGDYLKNRAAVLKEEPTCRICGARPSVTADHIVPKSRGGGNERSNLRGVCKECHDKRSQQQAAAGRRV